MRLAALAMSDSTTHWCVNFVEEHFLTWPCYENTVPQHKFYQRDLSVTTIAADKLTETSWYICRTDSRLAPSHRETSLQCNAVSYWLSANLESALYMGRVLGHYWLKRWLVARSVANHNPTPWWLIFNPDHNSKRSLNCNHYINIFCQRNVFENVARQVLVIFFMRECVEFKDCFTPGRDPLVAITCI